MAVREEHDAHPARTWGVRAVSGAAALLLVVYVRAQIADSEFRISEAPQRIALSDEILEPEPEETEILEEPEPEELVEMEPDEIPEMSDEPMPSVGDLLGLDSDAAAGGDAFGLVARRGGRDLLETAGGGLGCEWYATVLGEELNQLLLPLLSDNPLLRRETWSVIVELWLAPDGAVEQFRNASTGNVELDREITAALDRFDRVGTPPPPELPQPVRIRVRCQA